LAPWNLFEAPWPVPLRWRSQQAPPKIAVWLLRFMIFRSMFASGLVKIGSHDPTWQNVTAMTYHFETQPIPTPLTWDFHHLPVGVLRLSAAGTFVCELVAPMMIFAAGRPRMFAAIAMAGLHAFIALTGNYTFLNFLCIVLCITLLNDQQMRRVLPSFL